MKCPVCKDVTLLMSEKKGVEIDYCPECRGIWLDRFKIWKTYEEEKRIYFWGNLRYVWGLEIFK